MDYPFNCIRLHHQLPQAGRTPIHRAVWARYTGPFVLPPRHSCVHITPDLVIRFIFVGIVWGPFDLFQLVNDSI